jgi:hypothetical protein
LVPPKEELRAQKTRLEILHPFPFKKPNGDIHVSIDEEEKLEA